MIKVWYLIPSPPFLELRHLWTTQSKAPFKKTWAKRGWGQVIGTLTFDRIDIIEEFFFLKRKWGPKNEKYDSHNS